MGYFFMSDEKATITLMSIIKPVGEQTNGGWVSVGDGNAENSLTISKNGKTVELNDEEINELLMTLSTVNPSISVPHY